MASGLNYSVDPGENGILMTDAEYIGDAIGIELKQCPLFEDSYFIRKEVSPGEYRILKDEIECEREAIKTFKELLLNEAKDFKLRPRYEAILNFARENFDY